MKKCIHALYLLHNVVGFQGNNVHHMSTDHQFTRRLLDERGRSRNLIKSDPISMALLSHLHTSLQVLQLYVAEERIREVFPEILLTSEGNKCSIMSTMPQGP